MKITIDLPEEIQNKLQSFTSKQKKEQIIKWIKLGQLVHNSIHISENNEMQFQSFDRALIPINNRISDLKSSIDTSMAQIIRQNVNSTRKGKSGEDWVQNIVEKNMPDLVCDVTTKVGHSADMCLKSNDGRKIRVEVKRYTKPVPHKEVDKFFRDLKELGSSWGLLLSLNTPVSGVSSGTWIEKQGINVLTIGPLHSGSIDSLPDVGAEAIIVCAIRMIFNAMLNKQGLSLQKDIMLEASQQIQELTESIVSMQGIRNKFSQTQSSISKLLGDLYGELYAIELKLQGHCKIILDLANALNDENIGKQMNFDEIREKVINWVDEKCKLLQDWIISMFYEINSKQDEYSIQLFDQKKTILIKNKLKNQVLISISFNKKTIKIKDEQECLYREVTPDNIQTIEKSLKMIKDILI